VEDIIEKNMKIALLKLTNKGEIISKSFLLFISLQSDHQRLIKSLFHAIISGESINRFPPSIFLIGGNWCIIGNFGFSFPFFIKMPITMCLRIIFILINLKFIKSMGFFNWIILFFEYRQIVRIWACLHQSLHLYIGSCQQCFPLFLN
jgi:hypothetical protein